MSLPTALHDLERWLREKDLLGDNADEQPAKFAFITCGDWDFKNALPRNCDLLGLPVPPFMQQWYPTHHILTGLCCRLTHRHTPLPGSMSRPFTRSSTRPEGHLRVRR